MQLHIPKPCHENWNAMSPAEKGRFCQACQKQVLDFSGKSKDEIITILRQSKGAVCGRVPQRHLSAISSKRKKYLPSFLTTLFTFLGISTLFTINRAQAQQLPDHSNIPVKNEQDSCSRAQNIAYLIEGEIKDKENGEPLPFANVTVKSKDGKLAAGTVSDFNGKFKLRIAAQTLAKPLVDVHVSFVGYHKTVIQDVLLRRERLVLDLDLSPEETCIITGLVIMRPVLDKPGQKTFSEEEIRNMPR